MGTPGGGKDQDRGALINGITALIKRDLRELSHPFCHVRTQQEDEEAESH